MVPHLAPAPPDRFPYPRGASGNEVAPPWGHVWKQGGGTHTEETVQTNAGSRLGQRLRRWHSLDPALVFDPCGCILSPVT